MAEFPELQGLENSGCVQTNPVAVDPIIVTAPYGSVDEAFIEQEPLLAASADPEAWKAFEALFNDGEDSPDAFVISHGANFENEVWNAWSIKASAAKNNTTLYLPEAKERIVALAAEAYELLQQISRTYTAYDEEVMYPLKTGFSGPFALSVPDEEVKQYIDFDKVGLGMSARAWARKQIRNSYYKAGKLLWCAIYGGNQSEVWRENQAIFDELQGQPQFAPTPGPGPGPGMGLAPVEPVEPPLPEFAPLAPPQEPSSPPRPTKPRVPSRQRPGRGNGNGRHPDIGEEEPAPEVQEEKSNTVKYVVGVGLLGLGAYGIYQLTK